VKGSVFTDRAMPTPDFPVWTSWRPSVGRQWLPT